MRSSCVTTPRRPAARQSMYHTSTARQSMRGSIAAPTKRESNGESNAYRKSTLAMERTSRASISRQGKSLIASIANQRQFSQWITADPLDEDVARLLSVPISQRDSNLVDDLVKATNTLCGDSSFFSQILPEQHLALAKCWRYQVMCITPLVFLPLLPICCVFCHAIHACPPVAGLGRMRA